jgi:hypothetical protein
VSRLAAREHYGVVFAADMTVDEAASKALRDWMRSRRKAG